MSGAGPVARCGYVAIAGRPNVGKSTLLNHLVGQKVSITSRKPQTTRQNLLGILTRDDAQIVFVDTPGMHRNAKRAINRYMNRAARAGIEDVDVIVMMIESGGLVEEDRHVLNVVAQGAAPVILAINKVDRLAGKDALLPVIREASGLAGFAEVVPVSALRGTNLDRLIDAIVVRLPEGAPLFPDDQVTDRSERFLCAEIIREKLMRKLGDELPYRLTVEIEQFSAGRKLTRIGAVIWVERESQKGIVIGKQGAQLKAIGGQARVDMEKLLGAKVFLRLWVKVKEGWSDDERLLQQFGYTG